jgi:hypothetical protein
MLKLNFIPAFSFLIRHEDCRVLIDELLKKTRKIRINLSSESLRTFVWFCTWDGIGLFTRKCSKDRSPSYKIGSCFLKALMKKTVGYPRMSNPGGRSLAVPSIFANISPSEDRSFAIFL